MFRGKREGSRFWGLMEVGGGNQRVGVVLTVLKARELRGIRGLRSLSLYLGSGGGGDQSFGVPLTTFRF